MSVTDSLRLVIDDPERGPRLTPALVQRLRDQLSTETSSRIVVLEGKPGAFCEGLDLRTIGGALASGGEASVEGTLGSFRLLLDDLRADPRPVVAVVDGAAMGGGVGIAAAADLVIASERASFSLPETLFGLIPAIIFPFLADRVGVGRARSMAFSGDALTAARAVEWGLADQLSTAPAVDLGRLERRLLRQDGSAHASLKRLVNRHFGHPPGYGVDALAEFADLLASDSTRRRLARFAAGGNPWPDKREAGEEAE